jgi:hypothetical protein
MKAQPSTATEIEYQFESSLRSRVKGEVEIVETSVPVYRAVPFTIELRIPPAEKAPAGDCSPAGL